MSSTETNNDLSNVVPTTETTDKPAEENNNVSDQLKQQSTSSITENITKSSNDSESVQAEVPVADIVPSESVEFNVVFKNEKFQIKFEVDKTILQLKEHLKTLTNIPPEMQKIMYKGLAKDDQTIKGLNIKNGDKLMLIGSTLQDIVQVQKPTASSLKSNVETVAAKKEPLCNEQQHKRVLEKYGKPDDCMPGLIGVREPLPTVPLYGMLNKSGLKVRLTFKLEIDELWLSTKERTEKIPMSSIKTIVSEAITDHPQYHIMGIQLGPTESSRYWIYWVPAQYIDSIKSVLI